MPLGAADDLPVAGGVDAGGNQHGHALAGPSPAALGVDAADEDVGIAALGRSPPPGLDGSEGPLVEVGDGAGGHRRPPQRNSRTSSILLVETPARHISTMASSSSGALSVSSTVFLTRFLMSLCSDSSSTDEIFADAARAPSSMICCLAVRNHKTGRGPCSAMRLSICERNYASPKLLMSQRSVISGSSATVSRHAWAN